MRQSQIALLITAALLALASVPARAQDAAAAKPAAPAAAAPPAWSAQCSASGRQQTPECSMQQRAVLAKTNQLVAAISLRVPPDSKVPVLMLQTPVGLYLPAGVQLKVDQHVVANLPLQTCDAGGCYAGTTVSADVLLALEGGQSLGLTFANVNKQEVTVPFSLAGFTAAFDRIK